MFNDYNNCPSNDKVILKSQERFKSDCHNVCTELINKIALSMIKDYNHLIKLQHIHTEQMHIKYAKARY